jgi:amino acid transporter
MKNKIVLVLCMLLFLNLVSAVPPVTQVQQFPEGYSITVHPIKTYFKAGEDVLFHAHIFNSSNGYPINSSLECFLHLYNTTNHKLILQTSTVNDLFDYEFFVKGGNFTEDVTSYHIFCLNGEIAGDYEYAIEITPTGNTLETSIALLILFVLLILIVFMIFAIRGIFKADEGGWQIVYICLSYILLFSVFFLLWLVSKNYLYDLPILESVFWIIWLILSILFFPFIIIVSAYILKKQAEALMEKDFVQQGYTREEARDMSKKSRRR